LQQKVEQELARENKQSTHTGLHPKVPPPIILFAHNDLLRAELERVEQHIPIPPLDSIRYQLPGPTSSPATEEDWRAALNNAKAQLEHQRIRQSNIALLQTYGSNAWRMHNFHLEHTAKQLEEALEELKQRTTDVNRERKQFQTRLGNELTALETRWTQLISNVLQIELANVALEAELNELRRREAELEAS